MVNAELVIVGVFLLAFGLNALAESRIRRADPASGAGEPRPWIRRVWYVTGLIWTSLLAWGFIRWQVWNPRQWDLGAFAAIVAVAMVAGFLSQHLSRRPGERHSLLPVPVQAFIVGVLLGSALTTHRVWADPPSLFWLAAILALACLQFRDVFHWGWTEALRPLAATAAQAVLRLRRGPRHP